MSEQDQFLDVIDRDEAERRFHAALNLAPLPAQRVPIAAALGRVLAEEVRAPVDVPSFDRSNVDGYAVQAADTFGASERQPRQLAMLPEKIATGIVPRTHLAPGQAAAIATGGMVSRGADAVVMVEHTDIAAGQLLVRRAVAAGANVAYAGTDIAAGELVLHSGQVLTSRETGLLAAIGVAEISVVRRPRVAVVATGDEVIAPGERMGPSLVFDSNSRIVADAVRELGGEAMEMGIVGDDLAALRERLAASLEVCDVVVLSGGTSKGEGDLCYRAVGELREPGIVVHGVALKPGKPICLAVTRGRPVIVLPGFPTSAIFTFHEFVAPVIRRLAGLPASDASTIEAELPIRVNSEIGRTEYLLVNLIEREGVLPLSLGEGRGEGGSKTAIHPHPLPRGERTSFVAWPMGKGSGSVTAFSRADGFIAIGRQEEILEAGQPVQVTLLARNLAPADLVVIGSHCVGLDLLLGEMQRRGWRTKFLAVGSTAGLDAAGCGQCDVAGVHLLDPASGRYNEPFLTPAMTLVRGYARMQGVVYRPGDARFEGTSSADAISMAAGDPHCLMVNRNAGSGTRILIDRLLAGAQPPGYQVQPKNHTAVAAAIAQGRADWGVCIASVARQAGLGFLPLQEEQYDFVIPRSRADRPAVREFVKLLSDPAIRNRLESLELNAATGHSH